MMHFLKRKTEGKIGVVAMKLDISKAYDKLEWPFLRAMLEALDIPLEWIQLVMLCVTTIKFRVSLGDNL